MIFIILYIVYIINDINLIFAILSMSYTDIYIRFIEIDSLRHFRENKLGYSSAIHAKSTTPNVRLNKLSEFNRE